MGGLYGEEPYWGGPDANIDWCEPNYDTSAYVAEFWNTLSSVPIALFGLYGLYTTHRYALGEPRHYVSFLGLILVGVGSTAFHATLKRSAQAADELPMLYTAAQLLYNTLDHKGGFPWSKAATPPNDTFITHRIGLKSFLLTILTFMTIIYFYIPEFFSFFFIGYVGLVLSFTTICAVSIYGPHSKYSWVPRTYFILAALFYFGGSACWLFENLTCHWWAPTHFYLHSVWHISAGIGVFISIQTQIAWRGEYHGATVRTIWKVLPLVEVIVDGEGKKREVMKKVAKPLSVKEKSNGSSSGNGTPMRPRSKKTTD